MMLSHANKSFEKKQSTEFEINVVPDITVDGQSYKCDKNLQGLY